MRMQAGRTFRVGRYLGRIRTTEESISRAMPLRQEGLVIADEFYALTAFLLYKKGIIQEGDETNATSLLKLQMPHRDRSPVPDISNWKAGAPMSRPFRHP